MLRWLTIDKFSAESGYTPDAVRSKVFVYRVEGLVKSRYFHETVDKSREFGYLKLDEWERVQRICQN